MKAAYYQANRDKYRAQFRDQHLRRKYGITSRDYERLLKAQGGKCKMCHRLPTRRRLHVDHNHQTGAYRGLLCSRCNTAIGILEPQNLSWYAQALSYLARGG